ncbi:MAG: hypothetical protein QM820_11170 [Minicystis sp.]
MPRPLLHAFATTLIGSVLLGSAALAQSPPPPTPAKAQPAPAQSAAPAAPPASTGPTIILAPEDADPSQQQQQLPAVALGQGKVTDPDLLRGLRDRRFRTAEESRGRTSIGGYGELQVVGLQSGKDAPHQWTADVRRLVIFVAHSFTDTIRAYTELEVEHARQAEIEQAIVEWSFAGRYAGLRAGLLLLPVGMINEVHEPPIFNGVVRPRVETVVIPSTWRELGVGFFGNPTEQLRYQVYAVTGLDPLLIDGSGFASARGNGMAAKAKAWAAVARVEYEPVIGLVFGASGYASDMGKNGNFYLRDRSSVNVSAPLLGYSIDARFRRAGLEWKALFTEWHLPEAGALMHTFNDSGKPIYDAAKPAPTRIRGAYVEAGYDVLHPFGLSHQVVPFARIEYYNTQSAVPDGYKANPVYSIREYTFGASYKPIREVVFKADYQIRNRQAGPDETQANFGVGFMY